MNKLANFQNFRESLVRSIPLTEELKEEDIKLSKKAIDEAVEEVNPSGLKDIILEIPKVYWSDIGGYEDIKKQIYEVIEMPLKHPEAFTRMGIKPARVIITRFIIRKIGCAIIWPSGLLKDHDRQSYCY